MSSISATPDTALGRLLNFLGIPQPLAIGFIGFTIFMIGDGIELGFLGPYLSEHGLNTVQIATLFTVYGVTCSISAWLSGALSDGYSPYKVMWAGLIIWVVMQVFLLLFGIARMNYSAMLVMYALRGFGYPLFAYGFLCWIAAATPGKTLGSAMGWFWFFNTLGLMTIAPFVASCTIPLLGEMNTFWVAWSMVIIGGLVALLGLKESTGKKRLAPEASSPTTLLFKSVSILWRQPKAAIGATARMINTSSIYAFMPVMPTFYTHAGGFTMDEWLKMLSIIFFSNILANLFGGILGDKIGHRKTITLMGGLLCAITTPLFYYIPLWYPGNTSLALLNGVVWGIGLAGYVPLSALMPLISPKNKGAMIACLSLGAGASMWLGPLLVSLFESSIGLGGVSIILGGLYVSTMIMTAFLTINKDEIDAEESIGLVKNQIFRNNRDKVES